MRCSIKVVLVTNHTYTTLALESSATLSSLAINSRSRGTSGWPDSEIHCFLKTIEPWKVCLYNVFQLWGVIESGDWVTVGLVLLQGSSAHLRSAPTRCIDTCWTAGILGSAHWSAGSRGTAAGAACSGRPARWTPPPGSSPSAARGPHGPPVSLAKLQIMHFKARERKWFGLTCTTIAYTTVERCDGYV